MYIYVFWGMGSRSSKFIPGCIHICMLLNNIWQEVLLCYHKEWLSWNTPFATHSISFLSQNSRRHWCGVFWCGTAPPGDGCQGCNMSPVVHDWPDFPRSGIRIHVCCTCGKVVHFGGKAISSIQTDCDLLITRIVVVSINMLAFKICGADQPDS